ncbi:MAG: hypothetical protein Fues2KO_05510 [Fuerstiella sp.]
MQSPREFLECDDQTPKIFRVRLRCTFYNDFEVYFLQPATCTNPFTIPESGIRDHRTISVTRRPTDVAECWPDARGP